MKTLLYCDMDNVLVDFHSGLDKVSEEVKAQYADDGKGKPHYDDIPGIFALMEPMPGAKDAVNALKKKYFGEIFYKRIIFSHHKNLCLQPGAYLIDDRPNHGADQFGDHHIQFGTPQFTDWQSVLNFLLP